MVTTRTGKHAANVTTHLESANETGNPEQIHYVKRVILEQEQEMNAITYLTL
jgi:hypothetical protein